MALAQPAMRSSNTNMVPEHKIHQVTSPQCDFLQPSVNTDTSDATNTRNGCNNLEVHEETVEVVMLPRRSAYSSALLKDADDLDELLDNVDRQVQDGQVRHTFLQRDKPKRDIDKLHAAANRLVFPAQPLRGRLGFNVPLSKPKVQFQSLLQPSFTTRRQHVDHAPRRMTTCNQERALLHRHLQKLLELMRTFRCHSESPFLSDVKTLFRS